MQRLLTRMAAVLGVGAAQVNFALLAPTNAGQALGPILLFNAAIVVVVAPWLPLLLALPSAFAYRRVGPAGLNVSVADMVMLLAVAAGIRFVPWQFQPLRRMLWAVAVYEGVLLVAVVATPTRRAELEWLHRISLSGGAMLVGSAIAARGLTARALRCYFCVASVIAIFALAYTITHHFQPAYPLGVHKNLAGVLLMAALLVTFVAPRASGLGASLLYPLRVILVFGLLSTQARGSMVGLTIALVIWAIRSGRFGRTGPIVILGLVTMVATVVLTTNREVSNADSAKFGGINQRFATNDQALAIWQEHVLTGAGLRYFNDRTFDTIEPENVVVVSLAEAGCVGLGALIVLLALVWGVIRRLPGEMGDAGRFLFGAKLVESLFGIFWVAGGGSIMWVVIGLAVGMANVSSASPSNAPFLKVVDTRLAEVPRG